jgi:hypothetical protein
MQVQSMNLKLNMKDINKILAKAHFKCIFFFKWCEETTHFCRNLSLWIEAVGSLPVMSSLLPHVLWGRSQISLFFASVVSPALSIFPWVPLLSSDTVLDHIFLQQCKPKQLKRYKAFMDNCVKIFVLFIKTNSFIIFTCSNPVLLVPGFGQVC